MALSADDTNILEEIVKAEGNCLDSKRCMKCPFRARCLPEFLNTVPPSQPQRLQMAMAVLTHHLLMDGSTDEVEQEYTWEKV